MFDLERVNVLIDWLIFEKKIKNRRDLADKMGYNESSLSQILNGKVNLSSIFIKKLLIFDGRINKNWLLRKSDSMLLEQSGYKQESSSEADKKRGANLPTADVDVLIDVSTRLGEQVNENKHLRRVNMELTAQVDVLKKENDELRLVIHELKKQGKPYTATP